jgi:hypothetical protein
MAPAKVSSTVPPLKMNKSSQKGTKKKKPSNYPSRPSGKRRSRDNLNEETGCPDASSAEDTGERCATPE